jgi:hypothetical protein
VGLLWAGLVVGLLWAGLVVGLRSRAHMLSGGGCGMVSQRWRLLSWAGSEGCGAWVGEVGAQSWAGCGAVLGGK